MSKILVVDDEVAVRNLCSEALKRGGHEVVTLPGADQIFEILKSEKPDLVILDVEIPGEEGLSLLNRMPRQKEKQVPVIIFSGCVTPELEKQAMGAGAVEVLCKGEGVNELCYKVNKILALKKSGFENNKENKKEKIMVVDDEPGVRKLLKKFFERKGYCVVTAENGEEAIALFEKECPKMILLDITMPGMDGILTLKKIRELDSNVGVVMATGMQDEQAAKETTKLGAYAYVLKPFDMEYLEMVVLTRLLIAA